LAVKVAPYTTVSSWMPPVTVSLPPWLTSVTVPLVNLLLFSVSFFAVPRMCCASSSFTMAKAGT